LRRSDISQSIPGGPLSQKLRLLFDTLPPQLQAAAKYILEKPHDVAILSMREQARRAGVPAVTMTRLAQRLELEGYNDVRELYADAIRGGEGLGFAERAGSQLVGRRKKGDTAAAVAVIEAAQAQLTQLLDPTGIAQLVTAAQLIQKSRSCYCLGLRACYAPVWHFHYLLSLLGKSTIMLDSAAGVGFDRMREATSKDVLVVASVQPYTRASVNVARGFAAQAIPIVAITDTLVSPLAKLAQSVVLIETESPHFFHGMTSAFLAGEVLAALVAAKDPEGAVASLQQTEQNLIALDLHVPLAQQKKPRSAS
jgi:DNA-binding MurR/RpiR family transcriptional regulator